MIGVMWMLWLTLNAPMYPHRNEVCIGAVYFIKHGEHAEWMAKKQLLCHIGAHDFYGDKR